MVEYLIGIDGGGTSTRALVARRDGALLGHGAAGPSALGQGIAQAWRNVQLAIRHAFHGAGLDVPERCRVALGAGLSGVSNRPWREAFLAADPGFAHVELETDSYAMLLGAHGGAPGAILIAGTGSVAEALRHDGTRCTVGGWGFPVGDEGSGAWLGLHAVRHAQASIDGRANRGALARDIESECGRTRDELQAWCDRAGQFAHAQLATLVFQHERDDPAAAELLARAVNALETIALAVDPRGRLPLAVAGSVARALAPRFAPAVRSRIVEAKEGAAAGALALIRAAARHDLEELL
ncbi:MAG TPA: BadF/BadG/BcrA/BcrD ATPase family protein [Ramlibacter sp.]|uniref:BadF/BadG/BcrA/BcrD ATPase family protein n=1 Tax=Ramlibacter sp. TaxID=1917967 RepID=UPI002CC5B348|nr:BadF/BadG/BcrA/BcrD ATPase family protein [Ramlibacter sp.]HVZ45687.1 BadF/BadG/BcrA/BcrD ATPase family protein [Ramlibacter sp.]